MKRKRPPAGGRFRLTEVIVTGLCGGLGAELIEGANQFAGNLLSGGLLDDEALHQVYQLAVAQDRNGGRGGRIAFKVAAGALCGLAILTGKDGDLVIGLHCAALASASRTPGRILPAAQPQIELTTSRVVPGWASAASTSSAVRVSLIPARTSSSRMGMTIISGYIVTSGMGLAAWAGCLIPFYRKQVMQRTV